MVNHPPPFTKVPTLIGWDFFCLIALVPECCWGLLRKPVDPYRSMGYVRTNQAVGLRHRVAEALRLRFVGSYRALPTRCNMEVRAWMMAKIRNALSGQRPDDYNWGIQDQSGGAP